MIVFRTFVATSIPIALAILAVGTAFILLFILAGLTDINTITPILVSMIGIGVGIDYSLFIVTRFRQFLHEGMSPVDAATEAGASAGRAVLFAGLTVAISVTGLAFFGLDFITKLGIGAALGVLTTVIIANSLLIAVLAKLGHKIDRWKVPFLKPIDDSEAGREKSLIGRWGRFVTGHAKPIFIILLVAGLLLAGTSGARATGRVRPGDAADQPDRASRLRPPGRGLRARLQRPDPDRRRHEGRRRTRRSGSTAASAGSTTSPRSGSRSSTMRRRSRSSSSRPTLRPRTRRPRSWSTGSATKSFRLQPRPAPLPSTCPG